MKTNTPYLNIFIEKGFKKNLNLFITYQEQGDNKKTHPRHSCPPLDERNPKNTRKPPPPTTQAKQ
jgi:hypothetical protein